MVLYAGLGAVGIEKGVLGIELYGDIFRREVPTQGPGRRRHGPDYVMVVEEVGRNGQTSATHELPFVFSMMLPAFRGVAAVNDA